MMTMMMMIMMMMIVVYLSSIYRKVLIENTIFSSSTRDEIVILRGHAIHAKV